MLYMLILHWNETDPPMPPEEAIANHFELLRDLEARDAYAKRLAPQGAIDVRPVMDVPDWPYGATASRKRHPM